MPSKLTRTGLARAAEILRAGSDGIALLRTVMAVECRGSGFDAQGRPMILYEPHVAYRCSTGATRARLVAAGLAYPKWGEKPYPKDSYPSYLAAFKIDPEIAAKACSWGLGQILGENHKAAGYSSASMMAIAMQSGEDEQALAQARFIVANPKMHAALLAHDWAGFALRYNGPGYAKNAYDRKLASAYARFVKDPWAGFSGASSVVPAGQTQQVAAQQAASNAVKGAVAAGASGTTAVVVNAPSKTTEAVVQPAPVEPAAPKPSIWPAVALGLITILVMGVLVFKAIKSRPTERVVTEG